MGKKKTIAELRKKAKSMRFYNRIGLKKVPWLGLSLAILLDMALFKILPPIDSKGKTITLHGFTLSPQPDDIQFPNRRKPPACSIAISLE